MSAQITEMCEQCSTCAEYRTKQQKERMIVTQVPDYPWQKVASDLFSFDGESYVLVGDYFSKFVEYVTTVPLAVGYGVLNLSVRSLDR